MDGGFRVAAEAVHDVDDAIHKLEDKTYGLCEECHELIKPARLELLPHTRYCIACQSIIESADYWR